VNFEILDFCFSLLFCIFVVIMSFLLHVTESLAASATQACGWGESQRTFVYIKDAIEAVLLMIVSSDILPFILN
jgi:nucleoside-diphosphate-sugar epimerase